MNRPAVQLLRALLLLLAVGCCSTPNGQTLVLSGPAESIEQRVRAIRIEAKRIDAANEAGETSERRQLTKDLPNWQFSGLFEGSDPIYLDAMFTEGEVVREESYYLAHRKLLLVKVDTWWDVDEPRKAPEPTTKQHFYIDHDQTIRHTTRVESKRPVTRTDDTVQSAVTLVDRSCVITKILLGGAHDAAVTDSLRSFPEAQKLKP